ncbi:MAG: glutathione S-transferase N-terminal domain-containing protein [Sneathiella sp.]|nr:glutathione S-transferase N-terminal domain-containing protein [Sneathiella sp.]
MKLYDLPASPNARRVRIFIAEKGLDIPKQEVDLSIGYNKTPEFLKKIPWGGCLFWNWMTARQFPKVTQYAAILKKNTLSRRSWAKRRWSGRKLRCGTGAWSLNC